MNSAYLGYGVHARHDAGLNQILLTVERDGMTHMVAVTQDELNALYRFAAQLPPLTGFGVDGPVIVEMTAQQREAGK